MDLPQERGVFQVACDKLRTDRNPVALRRELKNPDDSGRTDRQSAGTSTGYS